ncbi:glycosyltransferase [Aureimonas jatrophae]|uniref:Glycosyltransferase involved in cell wall bisynthesis n=1 Tax=Aureimonas jatrophae TaxID=1166073 RepID=A0A1H0CZP0_9HYPH|nr:glycosyltransferase [Aureimonas jatrophae]MBB3949428.1 glycosyltransferase involved in cell wall biosynthesis [Aureimonas jatrophae]SDN63329.1 Glycosyltransferase involved in cell wall bisynthesis [Aureimonas jatrophae]
MFVDLPPPVHHVEPWGEPFDRRLATLRRGRPRIAYFYAEPDNSTFRYRVFNMIEAIDREWPDASAAYFTLADGEGLARVAETADILVICRARYSSLIGDLVARIRRRGARVLFDVDDLVFDTRYVELMLHTLAQPVNEPAWDWWFAYTARIGRTLALCDGAITTNAYLADRIRDVAPIDVRIVPNFMNPAQIAHSRSIMQAKRQSGFRRDHALHIGYFSGSPTHVHDFGVATASLADVLHRYPEVRLRMVGYLEVPPVLEPFAERLDRHAFTDYVNLQGLVGATEINIAPLQDNRFTNCKSELKFFEASAVGTVTCASPTYAFAQAIRSGENGYLARGYEWTDVLAQMVEDLIEGGQRYQEIAGRTFEEATAHYSGAGQIVSIRDAILRGDQA